MTGLPAVAGLILAFSVFWVIGGFALRLGGALAFWAGLAGASRAAGSLAVALVGGSVWLLGRGLAD